MRMAKAATIPKDPSMDRVLIINEHGTRIEPAPRSARRSPVPDLTVELTGNFIYRELRIYKQQSMAVPLNASRIGKHITEVLPDWITAPVMRAAITAAIERRPVQAHYAHPDGTPIYRASVIAPSLNTVILSITRIAALLTAIL
jgi:hypothetical protein